MWEGQSQQTGITVAVVVSRFNETISSQLLGGAVRALRQHGVPESAIEICWVPGAFEIPLALEALARTGRFGAAVALGAVVRGSTPHFDYVADAAAQGIARVQLEHRLPIGFGLLTTDNWEQAVERAGGKFGNKGFEAAVTALEMAGLLRELSPD